MSCKFICILLIGALLVTSFLPLPNIEGKSFEKSNKYGKNIDINNNKSESIDDFWYYLPSYDNYAPKGLPDFCQNQQEDWNDWQGKLNLCGATSAANILWWFDSKHSSSEGKPGDGVDNYPLVQNYNAPDPSIPGPYADDHCYNNVNDNRTPWNKNKKSGELIEQIAWYTNRQKDMLLFDFFGPINALFYTLTLTIGLKIWFKNCNLQNNYSLKILFKPKFSILCNYLYNNSGIILGLNGPGKNPIKKNYPLKWGHYVAVAGINPAGYIALSDPSKNLINPNNNSFEHNNASIVSHDIFKVEPSSRNRWLSQYWLPDYYGGGYISGAIIITEN